jgi:hypothetical protein
MINADIEIGQRDRQPPVVGIVAVKDPSDFAVDGLSFDKHFRETGHGDSIRTFAAIYD